MKKTLFLTAVLATALLGSAQAASLTKSTTTVDSVVYSGDVISLKTFLTTTDNNQMAKLTFTSTASSTAVSGTSPLNIDGSSQVVYQALCTTGTTYGHTLNVDIPNTISSTDTVYMVTDYSPVTLGGLITASQNGSTFRMAADKSARVLEFSANPTTGAKLTINTDTELGYNSTTFKSNTTVNVAEDKKLTIGTFSDSGSLNGGTVTLTGGTTTTLGGSGTVNMYDVAMNNGSALKVNATTNIGSALAMREFTKLEIAAATTITNSSLTMSSTSSIEIKEGGSLSGITALNIGSLGGFTAGEEEAQENTIISFDSSENAKSFYDKLTTKTIGGYTLSVSDTNLVITTRKALTNLTVTGNSGTYNGFTTSINSNTVNINQTMRGDKLTIGTVAGYFGLSYDCIGADITLTGTLTVNNGYSENSVSQHTFVGSFSGEEGTELTVTGTGSAPAQTLMFSGDISNFKGAFSKASTATQGFNLVLTGSTATQLNADLSNLTSLTIDRNTEMTKQLTTSATSAVTVNAGKTLTLSGTNSSYGNINGAGTVVVNGDTTLTGTLGSNSTNLTVNEGKVLTLTGTEGFGYYAGTVQVNKGGTLAVDPTSNQGNFNILNGSSAKVVNNGSITVSSKVTGNAHINNVSGNGSISSAATKLAVSIDNTDSKSFSGSIEATAGTLTVTNGTSTSFAALSAIGGNLVLDGDNTTATSVTLSGNSITLGDTTASGHDYTLTTTTLTNSGSSTINANLFVSDGGTMDFSKGGVITMGCSVEIGSGVTLTLSDADKAKIANNERVQLFSSVESVTYNGKEYTQSDDLQVIDGLTFNGIQDNQAVVYQGGNLYVTPEPATATLSLLALAGLAARRRRH